MINKIKGGGSLLLAVCLAIAAMPQLIHAKQIIAPSGGISANPIKTESPPLRKPSAHIDHSLFTSLLQRHIQGDAVDYSGLKQEELKLDAYLSEMAQVVISQGFSRNEQLAYWINIYNAWTLKLILKKWPQIDSIKELGSLFKSPWQKKFIKVHNNVISLDYIEHDIIRPIFKDPRIHFAVNCSAKSCPPLLPKAYSGSQIQEQLDTVTRRFLNNPANYHFDENNLYVTRILKWYREDFTPDLVTFLLTFADASLKKQLLARGSKLKIKYLRYDWSLNALGK